MAGARAAARLLTALTLLAALAVLSACQGDRPAEPESSPSGSRPPGRAVSPSPTPTASPERVPKRPVTIAFAGDVHFEGPLRSRLAEPATALAPVTGALAAADLAVVNLETSIGEGGRPEPGKRFTFRAPASALTALAAAGVDVATMANNHALDFGRGMLPSTFTAVAAVRRADPPLTVVGIGADVTAAFRPALTDVGGTIVATIGATIADTDPTADPTGQWAATTTSPGTADAVDPRRLLRSVARAAARADVVVVYVHWGVQGESCPTGRQRRLARTLVARGADVVVGSHAHRLQGAGHLGDGYVAYGLGNYAWYTPSSGPGADTGVLTLTVRPAPAPDGRATVVRSDWEPARIGTDGLPSRVTGAASEDFAAGLATLRACAGLPTESG
jgi:poly-gamma-glutamate capsule biosynthesis protein CapA/YwtB (metallophosphatase superfamily)